MSTIQNNLMTSQYESYIDGELAFVLRYHMEGGQMWMLSVDTPKLMDRTSYGPGWRMDAFLHEVFTDVHRRRMEVLPFSPRARAFVMKHPEFLHLVPGKTPGHFPDLRLAAAFSHRRKTVASPSAHTAAKVSKKAMAGAGPDGRQPSIGDREAGSRSRGGRGAPVTAPATA